MHATLKEGLGFEAENGEDDGAGVDAGEGVAGGEEVDVSDYVGVVVVVAAERYKGAHAQAVRVEHLEKIKSFIFFVFVNF
jgi:hypothetical protein